MKKLTAWFLALLLIGCLVFTAAADPLTSLIYDTNENLSSTEEAEQLASSIYSETGVAPVYISAKAESDEEAQNTADAWYENLAIPDCVLLLDAGDMLYIYSYGSAVEIFRGKLSDCIAAYNNSADYDEAVLHYLGKANEILTGAAEEPDETQPEAVRPGTRSLVVDDADLLTDEEEKKLLSLAEEISSRQMCDVAVVTTWSLNGKTSEAYADDYFDYNGYGYGPDHDGILLLVAMEDRDYAITTTGYGITAFTDYGLDYLVDQFRPSLSNGSYYNAFRIYCLTCDDLLTQARNGTPYDVQASGLRFRKTVTNPLFILGCLLGGFLVSLIPLSIMKYKLENVKWKRDAGNYIREDSLQLHTKRDIYLYANTTSRLIETNRGSGSSGGGSSVHFGSSGISHGGTHGKF